MWVFKASEASEFVSSFCDPSLSWADFRNQLGKFTPCFTDVIILGLAHIVSIILCLIQIAMICNKRLKKFKVVGTTRKFLWSSVIASACCVLIPVLQLNARLGQAMDKSARQVPPHEYAELLLAALTWLTMTTVLVMELDHLPLLHRTSLRFAICLSAASELVKLRFLLEAEQVTNYFFWLYTAYIGFQLYLALLSLIFPFNQMDLIPAEQDGYLPLAEEQNGEAADQGESHVGGSRPPCPEGSAGLLSALTFSWMSPLVAAGFKRPLQLSDLWRLPAEDQVRSVGSTFSGYWGQQKRTKNPNLFRACWKTTAWLWITAAPFKLTNDVSQFAGPYFLGKLLTSVSNGEPLSQGYMYAACMFLGTLVGVFCDNQHFQRVMRAGFRLKAALVAEVHRKVFHLTPAARAKFTSGRIFNLVSSDAETVQSLCQGVFGFVSSPLRIAISMTLLVHQLGPSAFMAVLCIGAIVPFNMMIMHRVARVLKQALAFTDERTKLEGELVAGIEVVKCSAWEKPFKERIDTARSKELGRLLLVNLLQGGTTFLIAAIPTIVPVATFAVYLLLGQQLTAAAAFTALSLFNVLRFPLFQLPMLVSQYTQARVCLTRLREFLAAEELVDEGLLPAAKPGETAVHIDGDYSWDTQQPPSLTNIKLDVEAGTLVAVVGSTGCGKSSLLSAMLGYMQKVYGPPVQVKGRTAYVPQAAFITNASVRDNILFGLPYDEERYAASISAACLETDFQQLPGGDLTELGDRGVNVSGGQKQRISMARALYSNADVVLLDDPLSALDSKVGRQVFDHAIKGMLGSSGKTVILATNQLQFVARTDLVVYLQNGSIKEMGGYDELMASGKGFAALMSEALASMEEDSSGDSEKTAAASIDPSASPVSLPPLPTVASTANPNATQLAAGAKLTETEKSATGGISWKVVGTYLLAMGGFFPPLRLGFGFLAQELLRVGTNVWLSVWTDDLDQGRDDAMYYLNMYALISGLQLLMQLFNTFDVARYGLTAGRTMHGRMLNSLLLAPMAFFHTTPLGRIINRLTKDTTDIDRNLASSTAMSVRAFLQLMSTVALIGVTAPFALPFLVIIVMLFWGLYQYYQASMRQIKRLDATSRSPVLSSINDAIAGCPTIRAFGTQQKLMTKHALLVDENVVMSLTTASLNRWLSVRLEALGALATLAAAVVAVEQKGHTGQMGLVLSFALQITQITNMTLRLASVAENAFNAVERVAEYSELPQEAPAERPDGPPPAWPDKGTVEFKEVKMRYRPGLPLVLKGISFRIESCEKVGIVGRTGAGKSSLIGCLFRLSEVESGAVYIDDINIARVGLTQLRSHLAIIPQVPVLFTGSIRLNLSPFGLHSDAEMWNALRRANLAVAVESWPAGLGTELTEGGAPLSAGQKQLLALARAVLNPSKVLVLDEATANVDVETDGLIQKTLRDQFNDRTIIAIAHRLHTIMDGDKVLVLDHGTVAEFGRPAQLLANSAGIFSSMVADTGEASARFLHSVASGHASLAAHYDEQAAVALSAQAVGSSHSANLTLGSPARPTVLDTAVTLVSVAKAASKGLQAAIADLQRKLEEEDVHPPRQAELDVVGAQLAAQHGSDESSLNNLHQTMQQAVALVTDLATLAKQATTLLGPSSSTSGSGTLPGILTSPPRDVTPSSTPTAAACAAELFPRRSSMSMTRSSDLGDVMRMTPVEAKLAAARQLALALGRTSLSRTHTSESGTDGN